MDALSFLLGYHKGKAQGGNSGGLVETDVFTLQSVSGFAENTEDFSGTYWAPSPIDFKIKEEETYYVVWDGATYTCKGIAGSLGEVSGVYLGNGSIANCAGNDEPFVICYLSAQGSVQFIALGAGDSHEIRVYQQVGANVKPLRVTANGKYTAPEGEAYSPVTVAVAGGAVDFPFGLEEIYSETELTFIVGASKYIPNTPVAILADSEKVKNGNVKTIADGESGLVVWDGKLYAVYAGKRTTPGIKFGFGTSSMSVNGTVGNVGIPSCWIGYQVVDDTRVYGKSEEPFLIIANSDSGFIVAIPEDSTTFKYTIQIFKFVEEQTNE